MDRNTRRGLLGLGVAGVLIVALMAGMLAGGGELWDARLVDAVAILFLVALGVAWVGMTLLTTSLIRRPT